MLSKHSPSKPRGLQNLQLTCAVLVELPLLRLLLRRLDLVHLLTSLLQVRPLPIQEAALKPTPEIQWPRAVRPRPHPRRSTARLPAFHGPRRRRARLLLPPIAHALLPPARLFIQPRADARPLVRAQAQRVLLLLLEPRRSTGRAAGCHARHAQLEQALIGRLLSGAAGPGGALGAPARGGGVTLVDLRDLGVRGARIEGVGGGGDGAAVALDVAREGGLLPGGCRGDGVGLARGWACAEGL